MVEVIRLGKPLIASPNPRFPDNHHVEICEALSDSCWVVHDEEEFVEALEEVIKFVSGGGKIEVPQVLRQSNVEPLVQMIREAVSRA